MMSILHMMNTFMALAVIFLINALFYFFANSIINVMHTVRKSPYKLTTIGIISIFSILYVIEAISLNSIYTTISFNSYTILIYLSILLYLKRYFKFKCQYRDSHITIEED